MDHQNPSVYQTGNTKPPRSYGGLIAVLLILVIFLTGIVTVLSVMNIRLFTALAQREDVLAPVSFSAPQITDSNSPVSTRTEYGAAFWGMTGELVTSFYEQYYHIPAGIYITQISESCHAYTQGVRPGDILVNVEQTRITDLDMFTRLLEQFTPGQEVSVEIYRDGAHIHFSLIAQEDLWN